MTIDSEVVAKFRSRHRAASILGVAFFLVLGAGILSLRIGPVFGLAESTPFVAAWGVAVVLIIPAYFIYRCPGCGAPITGAMGGMANLLDLSATKCRRCGVSFK